MVRIHPVFAIVVFSQVVLSPRCLAKDVAICDSYVGTTVTPVSFDIASRRYKSIPPKDEFETTSDYQKKVAGIVGTQAPLIIGKRHEGSEHFVYDADTQTLKIKSFAFHNTTLDMRDALRDTDVKPDYFESIYTVISQVDTVTGSYTATNAFGVPTTVTKWTWAISAIFDRPGASSARDLFKADKDYVVATIQMPPAEAKELKSKLKLAFVVTPKAPYYKSRVYDYGPGASFVKPREVKIASQVLIADINCGLVMDGSNKVIAAIKGQ